VSQPVPNHESRIPGSRITNPESRIPRSLPALYAIVDVELAERVGRTPVDVARAFLAGGARLLQLRAKTMASGAFLLLATELVALASGRGAIVIVNDRADIARLAGAGGVHLGQEDLAPARARSILGGEALIGLSTHSGAQLEAARREPVDYLAIGPVFGTVTKATGYRAVGLASVARAARTGPPIVAIGGITLDNARSVIEAGAASVAVISDLLTGGDPEARVRSFVQRLDPRI
jgi:thiamine-phosphate pyrophosphorylase